MGEVGSTPTLDQLGCMLDSEAAQQNCPCLQRVFPIYASASPPRYIVQIQSCPVVAIMK
jgi:hypothetical protein